MPPVLERVPLDRSSRQIRLLSFRAPDTADTARIRCRLATYDLDKCPPFVALSYAWGDEHPLGKISLNSEVFRVRPNLHSALSVLWQDTDEQEHKFRYNFYWIDAICINQKDNSERGHQVNLMGAIYSQARSVFVWLGPGSADKDRATEDFILCCKSSGRTNPREFRESAENVASWTMPIGKGCGFFKSSPSQRIFSC